jgi:hypothetical protein
MEEDQVTVEANIIDKAGDMPLHTSTSAMTTQGIPSKESLCHTNDIHVKEGDLSESKGNSLYVDKLVTEKKNENSGTQLDIRVLKESIVEPENIDEEEIISDQVKGKRIPEPKLDIPDVIDFADVASEKIIIHEDSFDSEPTVKEESESTHEVEPCSKLKDGTDDMLPAQNKFVPQIVTHMKKGKVGSISDGKVDNEKDVMSNDEVLVHKVQSAIEPTLFYSKENLSDVRSHDSKHRSSDITGKTIMSDVSESHCDSKHQHVSSCTEEEFPSSTPRRSSEDGQACDNSESFIEGVFQKKVTVEQCDKISEDHVVGVISDVNGILHDVKQLEGGESLQKVSSFINNSMVESSNILDAKGSDSKVSDSKNMFVEEEVSPEEQAIKESVLSALGLQPLRATQVLYNIPSLAKDIQTGRQTDILCIQLKCKVFICSLCLYLSLFKIFLSCLIVLVFLLYIRKYTI